MDKFAAEEAEPEVSLDLDDELFDNVPFQFDNALSPEAKNFLSLPSKDRDDNMTEYIIVELNKLDFFQKFTYNANQKLCKVITYKTFQDKDYLLKQGEDVFYMYILLSGDVALTYNLLVLREGELFGIEREWPARVLHKPGEYFGHSDILGKRPSTVDACAVGHCEVLMLDVDDFATVYRVLKSEQRTLRVSIQCCSVLRKFKWLAEELFALEMFSKVKEYTEAVEIHDGSEGTKPKWSHFLVEGEFTLAREVPYYAQDLGTSKIQFKAANVLDRDPRILTKDLLFQDVQEGYFFGVGEDFGANRVLASPNSKCLSVMRQVLEFKNQGLLKTMVDELMSSLPTNQVLLDNYLTTAAGSQEVENMVKDMLENNQINGEQKDKKPPFKRFV